MNKLENQILKNNEKIKKLQDQIKTKSTDIKKKCCENNRRFK